MKHLPLQNEAYKYVERGFKEWLDVLGYAPQSVYQMPNSIRELLYRLEQQGKTNLHQLSNKDIQAHYRYLQQRPNMRKGGALSAGSLNKHVQALQKFSDYLRQTGKVILPKLYLSMEEKSRIERSVLSIAQVQHLYHVATITTDAQDRFALRDKAILSIFYGCGLRRNEGYELDVSDVNFDKQVIYVRKGKNYKERLVPVSKASLSYLQDYLYNARPEFIKDNKEPALLLSQQGKRMQGQTMLLRLKILLERMEDRDVQEKEIGLHSLRHSIATHLLQRGMKLENIARFLGHASLESTQIYTHLIEPSDDTL